jgi:hypothetical protein
MLVPYYKFVPTVDDVLVPKRNTDTGTSKTRGTGTGITFIGTLHSRLCMILGDQFCSIQKCDKSITGIYQINNFVDKKCNKIRKLSSTEIITC